MSLSKETKEKLKFLQKNKIDPLLEILGQEILNYCIDSFNKQYYPFDTESSRKTKFILNIISDSLYNDNTFDNTWFFKYENEYDIIDDDFGYELQPILNELGDTYFTSFESIEIDLENKTWKFNRK